MADYDDPRPSTQPIGSTEPAVAYDNLITLDRIINSTEETTNRVGESVITVGEYNDIVSQNITDIESAAEAGVDSINEKASDALSDIADAQAAAELGITTAQAEAESSIDGFTSDVENYATAAKVDIDGTVDDLEEYARAEVAKLGFVKAGDYVSGTTLEEVNEYAYSSTYGKFAIADESDLPYNINSSTYPDPNNDPNLKYLDELTLANLGDYAHKKFATTADAIASDDLSEGDYFLVTGLFNAEFLVTSLTSRDGDLDLDNGLTATLQVKPVSDLRWWNLAMDGVTDDFDALDSARARAVFEISEGNLSKIEFDCSGGKVAISETFTVWQGSDEVTWRKLILVAVQGSASWEETTITYTAFFDGKQTVTANGGTWYQGQPLIRIVAGAANSGFIDLTLDCAGLASGMYNIKPSGDGNIHFLRGAYIYNQAGYGLYDEGGLVKSDVVIQENPDASLANRTSYGFAYDGSGSDDEIITGITAEYCHCPMLLDGDRFTVQDCNINNGDSTGLITDPIGMEIYGDQRVILDGNRFQSCVIHSYTDGISLLSTNTWRMDSAVINYAFDPMFEERGVTDIDTNFQAQLHGWRYGATPFFKYYGTGDDDEYSGTFYLISLGGKDLRNADISNKQGMFIRTNGSRALELVANSGTVEAAFTGGLDEETEFTSTIDVNEWGFTLSAQEADGDWVLNDTAIRYTYDNATDLGSATYRFNDGYVTNGITTTSDETLKTDKTVIPDEMIPMFLEIADNIQFWKWIDEVEKKGDDARFHTGPMAQYVATKFEEYGFDAGDYGMYIAPTTTDDEGNESTIYSLRHHELTNAIMWALRQQQKSLEERITALE